MAFKDIPPAKGPRDSRGFLQKAPWSFDLVGLVAIAATAIATWVQPAPAVAVGGVSVTPSSAIATWVQPAVTVSVGNAGATPASAIATWTEPAPALALGDVGVTPTPAIATWAEPLPSVTLGDAAVTPAVAISTWTEPAAVTSEGDAPASPSTSVSTWVVPQVTADVPQPQTATADPAVQIWTALDPTAVVPVASVAGGATQHFSFPRYHATRPQPKPKKAKAPAQVAQAGFAASRWTVNPVRTSGSLTIKLASAIETRVVSDVRTRLGPDPMESILLLLSTDD